MIERVGLFALVDAQNDIPAAVIGGLDCIQDNIFRVGGKGGECVQRTAKFNKRCIIERCRLLHDGCLGERRVPRGKAVAEGLLALIGAHLG